MSEIKCPKCASEQIYANKKGFSAGKAVGGAILVGGVGLAAGAIGRNKVQLTCMRCGHKFKPGEQLPPPKIKMPDNVDYVGPEERKQYVCSGCGKTSWFTQNQPCPKCGRRITESDLIQTDNKSSLYIWITIIAIIIIALIILL